MEGQSTPLVAIALIGWFPTVFILFSFLPPRRAVLTAFLVAWLMLPVAAYPIRFVPDYDKLTATCFSALLAMAIFDSAAFTAFRPKWGDAPMVAYCVAPLFSSLSNGLGIYDGLTAAFLTIVTWGVPYFVGRVYFSSAEGLRELAIGVFVGGLVYVPLCLYEIRMSPQLHAIVYGYHPSDFVQQFRLGGWRPTVFMHHGLMVGLWMASASLAGVWLWRTRVLTRVGGIPMGALVGLLLVTTVLGRSTGALALLIIGLASLAFLKLTGNRLATPALVILTVLYIFLRSTGLWSGTQLVSLASVLVESERASSLETRLGNEDILADRAWDRPLFGWGGWGRNRVEREDGTDISITDGLWIITLGTKGFFGLGAQTAIFAIAILMLHRKIRPELWVQPTGAPAFVCSLIIALWMIDNLLNAMFNPAYLIIAGGLVGLDPLPQQRQADGI